MILPIVNFIEWFCVILKVNSSTKNWYMILPNYSQTKIKCWKKYISLFFLFDTRNTSRKSLNILPIIIYCDALFHTNDTKLIKSVFRHVIKWSNEFCICYYCILSDLILFGAYGILKRNIYVLSAVKLN